MIPATADCAARIEKSNVDVVVELVSLVMAQRAYELNARSVKSGDEMLQTANEIGHGHGFWAMLLSCCWLHLALPVKETNTRRLHY